ncbi:MAG: PIN domain-containing protein [Thermoguttaceae bacterium]|jgi:predicted nucleic acid-binding protein
MKVFLDTNLIVYANDARVPEKQTRAIEVVTGAMRDGTGVISTQVMQEYAVVAGGKLHQDPDTILRQLLLLESLEVVQLTPALIRRALELQFRYQIDYWDASILAAAEHAQCGFLLTEDLNPGQLYATVRIKNPFASGDAGDTPNG